jgi:tRNA(fMet)-specific endonuclease VapC
VTRFLIDSDCAVYTMTAQFPVLGERLTNCDPGEVAISAVNFAEVALGAEMGKPPPAQLLEAFVRVIPILPFDEAAARMYAKLPFKRARFDRLLAAHALSIGATVITNNEADFDDVPGLKTENWTV